MRDVRREGGQAELPDLSARAAAGGFVRPAGTRLMLVLLLAGCGGGGGGTNVETPVVPSASGSVPAPAPTSAPAGYVLVWSDEFTNDGLPDTARWDYDTERNAAGWFNNESQYYARGRLENSRVADGKLLITARKEDLVGASDWGGQHYTSARLITRGKDAWTYGFFEVRAKLPCGAGTWPAIWTLGSQGRWPDDGELDIMEQVGSDPSRIFGTVHTLQSGSAGTGGAVQVSDACSQFHNYQMTWTAQDIRLAVDGVEYYRYVKPNTGLATWPFDAPQYLLLNIAIGGDLGGTIDDAIFPVMMAIDYVRVYQASP